MKKKILMFFSLVFAILLAACGGDVDVKIEIQGINGVTDANINVEQKSIEFSVSSEISTFDVTNIIVPSDVVITAYQDEYYLVSLGTTVTLVDGLNTTYLKLTNGSTNDFWKLYITKLSNTTKSPKTIMVKELDLVYNLNDEFKVGVLTVTYNDESSKDINITLDMINGFDTTSYGQKKMTISYEGLIAVVDYSVVSGIKEIKIESWSSEYYVGDTELQPNGKLAVLYEDGTSKQVDITSNMVSNFDTATAGRKELTVTYEDKTVKFGYTVFEKEVSSKQIKEIEVESWIKDYLIGDSSIYLNGKLNVVYDDDTNVIIDITEDMVSEFDTNTVGDKELTITYKNKSIKFGYTVHNQYTSVTIEGLKTEYRYGQSLVGRLKFVLGEYEFTKPLKDYAEGYDSKVYGKQTVTVEEYNLSFVVEVVERNVDSEFVEPQQTTVTFDDIKPGYAIINAIEDSGRFAGEEFEYKYNYYMKDEIPSDDMEMVQDFFRKAGISKQQINDILDLYFKEAAPLLDKYGQEIEKENINGYKDLFKAIEKEDIAKAQEIIAQVLTIVDANQVTMFISEMQGSMYTNQYFEFSFITKDKDFERLDSEKLIKLLNASGLSNVAEFVDAIRNKTTDPRLNVEDIYFMVNMGYTLAQAVTEISANDIYEIKNYVLDLIDGKEIDIKELLPKVHKAADILEKLLVDTYLLDDIGQLFDEVVAKLYIYENGYIGYKVYNSLAKLISLYGYDLISIIKNITEDELETVVDFIRTIVEEKELSNLELAKIMVNLSKIAEPIISDLNSNDEAKDMALCIVTSFASDKNFYQMLSKALSWTILDSDKLTEEQATEITDSINNFIKQDDYLSVRFNYDVVVPLNSSIEYLLNALSYEYQVYYYLNNESTPIQLTVNTVSGLDTSTPGWHTVTVSQQGLTVKLYYYVLATEDELEVERIGNNLSEYIIYFDLNSNKPFDLVLYKQSIAWKDYVDYPSTEQIINEMYCKLLVSNSGINFKEYIKYDNVKFVVDTTSTGLKLGYIEYTTIAGKVLIPFQYYVYDSNNPSYGVEETTVYLAEYESYQGLIRVEIDFGRAYKEVEIMFDGAEIGTYTGKFDGVTFTFNVLREEELCKIKKVEKFYMAVDKNNPDESIKQTSNFGGLVYTLKGYNYHFSSYEEFMMMLYQVYNEPSIKIDWVTEGEGCTPTNYTIYDCTEIIYQGVVEVDYLSTEQFNSFDINISYKGEKYNFAFLESYEFTLEDLFDSCLFYKNYYYKNSETEFLTYEQLISMFDVTITLVHEEEYYNEYNVEFTDKSTGRIYQRWINVALESNRDVVINYDLQFGNFTFYNIPTVEEVEKEIKNHVYVYAVTLTGRKQLDFEESIAYLESLNPNYEVEIYDEWIEIRIITDEKEYYAKASLLQIDENSTIEYVMYETIRVFELDADSILEQLYERIEWWVYIYSSNGRRVEIEKSEFFNDLILESDLSIYEPGRISIKYSFHGAPVYFDIEYIKYSDDARFELNCKESYILDSTNNQDELEQLIYDNITFIYTDYWIRVSESKRKELLANTKLEYKVEKVYNNDDISRVNIWSNEEKVFGDTIFYIYKESASEKIIHFDYDLNSNGVNIRYEESEGKFNEIYANAICVNSINDDPFNNIIDNINFVNYNKINGESYWFNNKNDISAAFDTVGYKLTKLDYIDEGLYELVINNIHNNSRYIYMYEECDSNKPVYLNLNLNPNSEFIWIDEIEVPKTPVDSIDNVQLSDLMVNIYNLNYQSLNGENFDTYNSEEILLALEEIGYTITNMFDQVEGLVKLTLKDLSQTTRYFIVYDAKNAPIEYMNIDFNANSIYYTELPGVGSQSVYVLIGENEPLE